MIGCAAIRAWRRGALGLALATALFGTGRVHAQVVPPALTAPATAPAPTAPMAPATVPTVPAPATVPAPTAPPAPATVPAPTAPPAPATVPVPSSPSPSVPPTPAAPAVVAGAAAIEAPAEWPLRLAFAAETASGKATGAFRNQMFGVRLDVMFTSRVSLGGYAGYASLKGKDGRTGNLLPYAQVEYLAGDPAARVRFPLRFASGYLPRNGPVARASAGVAIALGPKVDLVTELLTPMIWLTNNQMLLSLNLSLELCLRL
jgi:hypothetical protein